MNVFLPYSDYSKSIECLDKKRCFKQLVEANQLIKTIKKGNGNWYNHPACRMFWNYPNSLIKYHNICYNVCLNKWKINLKKINKFSYIVSTLKQPIWLGFIRFHQIMKANLVRKNEIYHKLWPKITPIKGYLWPILKDGSLIKEIQDWKLIEKLN